MIVTGGKLYERCGYCQGLVRLNKPILGSLHFCLSPEDRARIDVKNKQARWAMQRQLEYRPNDIGPYGALRR